MKIWYFIHHTIQTPSLGDHIFALSLVEQLESFCIVGGGYKHLRYKVKLCPNRVQHHDVEPVSEVAGREYSFSEGEYGRRTPCLPPHTHENDEREDFSSIVLDIVKQFGELE